MPIDFAATKARFHLPEGVIYLDGNSLGPLPRTAAARVAQVITDEWGALLIRGWHAAGWMEMPARVGDRISALGGAEPGSRDFWSGCNLLTPFTSRAGDTVADGIVGSASAARRLGHGCALTPSSHTTFSADSLLAVCCLITPRGHLSRE